MTLILTVRGMPQIYYGDEIGMLGNKDKHGDGDIRRDFPGGWQGDTQSAFTKEGRTKIEEEYHAFTKKLLTWRKDKSVIHTGKTIQFVPENNVYVYFRTNDKETVMVAINNNPKSQTIDLDRFKEVLKNYNKGKDILTDKEMNLKEKLTIEGKKSMVIELN